MIIETCPVGPLQTNCYVIGSEKTKTGAIIDPGGDADQILSVVKRHGLTISHILLTHAHFDHIGAVADLIEATHAHLALHPADLPLLHAKGGAGLWGIVVRPSPDPDIELAEGQEIAIGTLKLQVLHTPGHTPGHVTFHEPSARAIFDGDVLFQLGIGRTDFPGSSYQQLMDSIRNKLFALPGNTVVYPGHGGPTTIEDERWNNPFL